MSIWSSLSLGWHESTTCTCTSSTTCRNNGKLTLCSPLPQTPLAIHTHSGSRSLPLGHPHTIELKGSVHTHLGRRCGLVVSRGDRSSSPDAIPFGEGNRTPFQTRRKVLSHPKPPGPRDPARTPIDRLDRDLDEKGGFLSIRKGKISISGNDGRVLVNRRAKLPSVPTSKRGKGNIDMAAMHEEEPKEGKECVNCGETQGLGLCSRCHSAYFCSKKCQKAYWPFHKEFCRRNDFADMIEQDEPKFARFIRRHGKVAVLKDDEVERIERAGKATSGYSRDEVMQSMYGNANPIAIRPKYNADDLRKMALREEEEARVQRIEGPQEKSWNAIEVPDMLGMQQERCKWLQNQSYVEIYYRLPTNVRAHRVKVELAPQKLTIVVEGEKVLHGTLFAPIKQDMSTWIIQDGVLEITLLKRYRRGLYESGKTNADTFWRSILQGAPEQETLQVDYPPSSYYATEYDKETDNMKFPKSSNRPMIDRSKERR
eukprot:scaffold261_cov336-Pavlova_lutheri.AAC.3